MRIAVRKEHPWATHTALHVELSELEVLSLDDEGDWHVWRQLRTQDLFPWNRSCWEIISADDPDIIER